MDRLSVDKTSNESHPLWISSSGQVVKISTSIINPKPTQGNTRQRDCGLACLVHPRCDSTPGGIAGHGIPEIPMPRPWKISFAIH